MPPSLLPSLSSLTSEHDVSSAVLRLNHIKRITPVAKETYSVYCVKIETDSIL